MKITILYDNETVGKNFIADWGFSCLIETDGRRILFDTGAKGDILFRNMALLSTDPREIDDVFISHAHFDHTGGLSAFLDLNDRTRYPWTHWVGLFTEIGYRLALVGWYIVFLATQNIGL